MIKAHLNIINYLFFVKHTKIRIEKDKQRPSLGHFSYYKGIGKC